MMVLERDAPKLPVDVFKSSLAGDARNRWFDKFTYNVYLNGLAGGNGEHSQADAIVAVICWDWVCSRVRERELNAEEDLVFAVERGGVTPSKYKLLNFFVSPAMKTAISKFHGDFEKRANAVDAYVLMYKVYGRKLLKWCKLPRCIKWPFSRRMRECMASRL